MDIRNTLANRTVTRAQTGLYFLEECLDKIHKGGTDPAYSRSIYILFSYNFELILKSRLILAKSGDIKEDFLKNVRTHELDILANQLTKKELNDIEIKIIRSQTKSGFKEYEVEMTDGRKIVIQGFIDVRYDFEKDICRNPDQNESNRMKKELEIMIEMVKKIQEMIS